MELQKIKRYILLAVFLIAGVTVHAEEPAKIEKAVFDLVSRYEGVEGVETQSFVKGEGLELVKMMLNKEFGRKFMKGVTSIVIMEYKDASQQVCQDIRGELDSFTSILTEIDFNGDEEVSENDFARCFISESESGSVGDFLIAMEDKETKMLIYMGGEIHMEEAL